MLELAAVGLVFVSALMLATWAVATWTRNAGLVDVAWAASFLPLALLYAWLGGGAPRRAWIFAGMMGAWSARLAIYLFRRVMSHHPVEDSRYQQLRAGHAPRADSWFFWFFQAQAVFALFFSLPALIVSSNHAAGLGGFEVAGIMLWAIGLTGESLADWQLARFKARPGAGAATCQAGLWRYSRHPNYFFEWLIWCGFSIYALGSPHGWIAIACPMVMLFLLFRVTGIPATEAAAVKRRGDEYREYQRTTSAFVPWFRTEGR